MHLCSLFNSTLLTVIWTFYPLKLSPARFRNADLCSRQKISGKGSDVFFITEGLNEGWIPKSYDSVECYNKESYILSSRLMLGQSYGCISSIPSAFPGLVGCLKPNFTIMVWFFCHCPAGQQPNVWSSGLWETTSQSSSVCVVHLSASVWHTCWVVYISTASLCKCRPHWHAVVFSEDSVLSCVLKYTSIWKEFP